MNFGERRGGFRPTHIPHHRRHGGHAVVVTPSERVTVVPPTQSVPEVRVSVDTATGPETPASGPEKQRDCSAWEGDHTRFARVVARHYLRDIMRRRVVPEAISCNGDTKQCDVRFQGGVTVQVNLSFVPKYVTAQRVSTSVPAPLLEYSYQCEPGGRIHLRRRV